MSKHNSITAASQAPSPIMQMLARHSRRELEGFISVAIDLLDMSDPDPDLEPNGDQEGAYDEDEISTAFDMVRRGSEGPGCHIADSDFDDARAPLWKTPAGRAERARRRELMGLPVDRHPWMGRGA